MTRTEADLFAEQYRIVYEHIHHIKLGPHKLSESNIKRVFCRHVFYHYTSIDVFHNIVDNNEFWAHNTRFSNDYTEEKVLSANLIKNSDYCTDNYFICLCEDGDLLSQWRGYCSDGGVSIELSFPRGVIDFTILGNNTADISAYYSGPLPVSYYLTEYQAAVQRALNEGDRHKFLPLFKNGYFSEEKEYRILFSNREFFLDKCIFERKLENCTRVPFLKIKFNNSSNLQIKKCLTLQNLSYNELIKTETINEAGRLFLLIPACAQQEEIYNTLSKKLKAYYEKNRIGGYRNELTLLCEGRPPVTKITVSPVHDRERVREQIEHFCKTRYWLRDVPVECSKIPYTYSLGKK